MRAAMTRVRRISSQSIADVEERLWGVICTHRKILEGPWKQLFGALEDIHHCSGTEGDHTVYMSLEEGAHGKSLKYRFVENNWHDKILLTPSSDLPLLVGSVNDMDEKARARFNQRLRGEWCPVTPRQDLIDLHNKSTHRMYRCYELIAAFSDHLLRKVVEFYQNKHQAPYRWGWEQVIIVHINGRPYVFQIGCPNTRVIARPDELKIEEPLFKDEQCTPKIEKIEKKLAGRKGRKGRQGCADTGRGTFNGSLNRRNL